MDARNYFNELRRQKLPERWNNLAAVSAARSSRDKAFFFGAYEGQRYNVGQLVSVTTPSMVAMPGAAAYCQLAPRQRSPVDCGGSIPERHCRSCNGHTEHILRRSASQPVDLGLRGLGTVR